MKVTLYMATSIDGYIAKTNGDSEWISEIDIAFFDKRCADADCIIVGNTTYKQYKWELYPVKWKENIVVSSQLITDDACFYAPSPKEALERAHEQWHKNVLLVGGGHINGSFLEQGLIDEIIIDIQPIILGKGIKLFEELEKTIHLKHKETSELNGWLTLIHYEVKK